MERMTYEQIDKNGVATEPKYPDIETRDNAWNVVESFKNGKAGKLL